VAAVVIGIPYLMKWREEHFELTDLQAGFSIAGLSPVPLA
jgi:hypothetical protein